MSAVLVHLHKGRGRGQWWPLHLVGDRVSASIHCPGCGAFGTLQDHAILLDGTVQPSVQCPNDCGFHELVKLEGWPPKEAA